MRRLLGVATVFSMLVTTACGDDDDETPLKAGTFQLTVQSINDGCLDGAMETLFAPGGPPYDLANPTAFPAFGDLPTRITVELNAPFTDMDIDLVKSGSDAMAIKETQMTNVLMDQASTQTWGDCNVDLTITGSIAIVDNDNLNVNLQSQASDPQSTGDTCPTFTSTPCTVGLTMTGERL